jgi:GNAT superfamily N-acetyltransferase
MSELNHRVATPDDMPALRELMRRAIDELQHDFLSPAQVIASHKVMGIDTQLVRDGTYFLLEADGVIAGCGGWSYRATLYGGDDSVVAREPALLDPAHDAAKVRAMYTNPDFTRRGIGRRMLALCEDAARQAGFHRVELMGTMAGVPLYRACGYTPVESIESKPIDGVRVPLLRMHKSLPACAPTRAAVAEFIERFERGGVSKAEWTHATHLVAGYWYVSQLGPERATAELRSRIRAHNTAIGTANSDHEGYHETITRLYAHGIAAALSQHAELDFESALVRLLQSPLVASAWPLAFYSRERLFSMEARQTWIPPDLVVPTWVASLH